MSADIDRWPGAWRRSVIGFCVLGVIRRTQPTHGYAVVTEIRSRLGTDTTGGVVYPLLNRLESEGMLVGEWHPGDGGPGRKTYQLTRRGHDAFLALLGDWEAFGSVVAHAMSGTETAEHEQ